jgi:hypothetical protein
MEHATCDCPLRRVSHTTQRHSSGHCLLAHRLTPVSCLERAASRCQVSAILSCGIRDPRPPRIHDGTVETAALKLNVRDLAYDLIMAP